MARTKGALKLQPLEIEAAWRLRHEDRLTWRKIGRIMRRNYSGLRRAVRQMEVHD